ncbi:hypothetical protein JZU46_01930 [bacterium]|jgi:hypothetical protein|nr:hypothetical protein [bacterium]
MYGQGTCSAYLPNGINKGCVVPLAEVDSVILTSPTAKFASLAEVLSLAKWKEKIQTDLSIYVLTGIYDYENTTDEPNIATMYSGKKLITNKPIPSAKLYVESNFCDYIEMMRALKQGTYGIIYKLRDGQLLMWKNSVGEVKPFSANLTAISKYIPGKAADISQSYPVYVNHQSAAEFDDAILVNPYWNAGIELLSVMPIGLNIGTTSLVAGGDVDVYVAERCGEAKAGLALVDFEVLESNVAVPAITARVDNTGGSYTLTLQKGAVPADIAAGDYMVIRVNKKTALVVDYLSNRLFIQA